MSTLNEANVEYLVHWINQREAARINKEAGFVPPWCYDEVINTHHFCNVHREDDRGTKELKAVAEELGPVRHYLPAFWTAARLFNRDTSLRAYWMFGMNAVKEMRARGEKVFKNSYTVVSPSTAGDKIDYVDRVVKDVIVSTVSDTSCRLAFTDLRRVRGLGSFMAGQIVADLKYTPYLQDAPDWHSFAVMGPGSQKGLNLIFGPGTTERNFMLRLEALREAIEDRVPRMHNQDLQNCMCEFSKYMRYKFNQPGRRRNYVLINKP